MTYYIYIFLTFTIRLREKKNIAARKRGVSQERGAMGLGR